jgi:succinate dehydrogenase / fumarate reductase, cytochrome b subunit
VFGLLGVAVFCLGANTAIYFATGSSVQDMIFGRKETSGARTCNEILHPTKPTTTVGAID